MGLVEEVVNRYQTASPIEVAKGEKIQVKFEELPYGIRVMDYSSRENRIYIEKRIPESVQRGRLCHTLGKRFLNPRKGYVVAEDVLTVKTMNAQASLFTVDLLEILGEYKGMSLFEYYRNLGMSDRKLKQLLKVYAEARRQASGLYVVSQ